MPARRVYEGKAELNIKEWLDSLKELETSTGATADNLGKIFERLHNTITGTAQAVKSGLQTAASQVNSIGTQLSGANQAIAQSSAAAKQANQQANQASQDANNRRRVEEADRRRATLSAQQDYLAEVARLRERQDRFQQTYAEEARMRRYATNQQVAAAKSGYQQELADLQRHLQDVRAARETASRAAADTQRRVATTPEQAASRNSEYQARIQEAQRAARIEEQLRRQVGEVSRAVDAASLEETRRRYGSLAIFAAQSANAQATGWEKVRTSIDVARERLQAVEDKYNSIYRAGSQLTQLGSMMTGFAQQLAQIGINAVEGASDFDLWAARGLAAVQAANSQMGEPLEASIDTLAEFRNAVLETGRDTGQMPLEAAQAWNKYQAAIGGPISSLEQLRAAQDGANTAMKVSVATATDVTTVIEGASAVVSQFDMPAEAFTYVAATMSNLGQTTQASFSDIAESFKYVGPFAQRIGMDFGQVAASLALLAQNGVVGSMAGRLTTSWIVNLVKPTEQLDNALKELFKTGKDGDWRSLVFTNGEFDLMKFLENYTTALEDASPALREFFNANLAGKEAIKVFGTLSAEYGKNKEEYQRLIEYFNSPEAQMAAFGQQWETVAQSVAVRWGQVTYVFEEFKIRAGTILATTLMPIMNVVGSVIGRFLEWAETHPQVAAGLASVAVALTILIGSAGVFLTVIGAVVQGITGLPILLATISNGFGALRGSLAGALGALRAIGPTLFGLNLPILAVIAAIVLLGAIWYQNVGGIRDATGELAGLLGQELGALVELLGGLTTMLTGFFTGNGELVAQGAGEMATAFVAAFYVIPGEILATLSTVGEGILDWFVGLGGALYEWGANLMTALAQGIYDGAVGVWAAAYEVAEGIAQLFRSFSPPRYGPLRGITVWGRNLMHSLMDGMLSADLSAIDEVAGRMGEAIRRNIEDGITDASTYASTVGSANNLVDDMLQIIRGGGRVSEDFFSSLMPGLGEWYDYIVRISLAYQDVYANERQLSLEKEKLAVLQAQRKEVDAANDARQTAFDDALDASSGSGYSANAADAIDPLSPEGRAKIAEMKRTLNREDFQNWINFQKRLWEQRAEIEDEGLAQQEEQLQTQVDVLEKQLDAAKAQYDYWSKIYEYAVKMYKLAEEQAQLEEKTNEKAGGGGGGGAKGPNTGTPADLQRFIDAIRKIVGADQAILDEETLASNRGGDDVGAVGDAERQRQREQERLEALEKENRKRRAQAEVDLINATSDAERDRIKQEADAWDAAYKKEKARLQERASLAKEVAAAAEARADASQPERTAGLEKEFQEDIKELLGEQTEVIKDANELKGETNDLDQAQVKAREQLRGEERKLRDLQAEGDKRRLDYEKRIREAGNDPEKIRRIEEEQEAWEAAYKRAVEVQQARVEAARRAQQDLQDEEAAQPPEEKKPKGAKPSGGGVPDFGGGGPGAGGGSDLEGMLEKARAKWKEIFGVEESEEVKTKVSEAMANIRAAITFLGDESIPAKEKLEKLGQAVAGLFGFTDENGEFSLSKLLGFDDIKIEAGSFAATIKQALIDDPAIAFQATAKQIKEWATTTDKDFNTWASNVGGYIKTWATTTDSDFNTMLANVGGYIKTWATTTDSDFNTLLANVGGYIKTWATTTDNDFNTLLANIGGYVKTWATTTDSDFNTLLANIGGYVKTWATTTDSDFNTLLANVGGYIKTWATTTDSDFNTLLANIGGYVKTWATTTDSDFNTLLANIGGYINTWATTTDSDFNTWVENGKTYVKDAIASFGRIFDPVKSFINALSKIRFPDIPDWLKGGGGNNTAPAGSAGGSYALGLDRVPYDMFPAYLHEGERVLTSAEAASYRAFEGALKTLGSAQVRLGGGQTSKSVTVNVGTVNASSESDSAAFFERVAFLTG